MSKKHDEIAEVLHAVAGAAFALSQVTDSSTYSTRRSQLETISLLFREIRRALTARQGTATQESAVGGLRELAEQYLKSAGSLKCARCNGTGTIESMAGPGLCPVCANLKEERPGRPLTETLNES